MSDTEKEHRRHRRVYHIVRVLLFPFFKWLFKIQSEPAPEITGPYLVYANHNTDLDPVLIHFSFNDHMYFVASEHIFRLGWISWLLVRYLDPIPRIKGSTDLSTVRDVMRRLRTGKNVCIFAEGDRSFNGLTNPVPPSIGKLAKVLKVPLVTYKFEGGYFTTPRWAFTMRRGRMRGGVVNVYTVEQLKEMSADDLNASIASDLFEDAYARQAVERVRFKGRLLAEGLETALFICPHCQQIGTLTSQGNQFSCECGLRTTYDEFGYLGGAPYSTVTEWDAWQQKKLSQIADELGDKPAFSDSNIKLVQVLDGHKDVELALGSLSMYVDRMVCSDQVFSLQDISDMALYGRSRVAFTCKNKHYVILSNRRFCGRKYLELYNILKATR